MAVLWCVTALSCLISYVHCNYNPDDFSNARTVLTEKEPKEEVFNLVLSEFGLNIARTGQIMPVEVSSVTEDIDLCDIPVTDRTPCANADTDTCSFYCRKAECCYDDYDEHAAIPCYTRLPLSKLTVTVKTGQSTGDGTQSKVYVRAIGTKGECNELELGSNFPPGSLVKEVLSCARYFGEVKAVRIRLEGSDSWYIQHITVVTLQNVSETFYCNKKMEGFETITCDGCSSSPCQNGGTCSPSETMIYGTYTCHCDPSYTGQNCDTEFIYDVYTTTGSGRGESTSDPIYLKILGSKANCTESRLTQANKPFYPGAVDRFRLRCGRAIGSITGFQFRQRGNDDFALVQVSVRSSLGLKNYPCPLYFDHNDVRTCLA